MTGGRARRGRPEDLNRRQRAFADAYAGPGTGSAAAREAGYTGSSRVLEVTASKLLRHPGVRARIEARLGAEAVEPAPAPKPVAPKGLRKGVGRGTATERVEILMRLARDGKLTAKERIAAVLAAAELEGERGRGRLEPLRPVLPPLPADETPPASSREKGPPKLALVTNEEDASLG